MKKSRFLSGFETQTVHANGIVDLMLPPQAVELGLLLHGIPKLMSFGAMSRHDWFVLGTVLLPCDGVDMGISGKPP